MAAPEFYQQSPEQITAVNQSLATDEATLAEYYTRWEDLEARQ